MEFTGREEVRINLDSFNTSVEPATEDMDYTITQQAFFFFLCGAEILPEPLGIQFLNLETGI